MKARYAFGVLALLLIAISAVWFWRWKQEEPRCVAIHVLEEFTTALQTQNSEQLLQTGVIPAAITSRNVPEQTEFLTKALQVEISPQGLPVLRKEGQFGPLTNSFLAEARAWASRARVKPEDRIAFLKVFPV